MGLTAEFNWYVVLQQDYLTDVETESILDFREMGQIQKGKTYSVQKDGFRIYPLGIPVPLIHDGHCLSLITIERMIHEYGSTILFFTPSLIFEEGCHVKDYYESLFKEYKQSQEDIDDGGQTDLRHIVNAKKRMRFAQDNTSAIK